MIYLLSPIKPAGYDQYYGFVVRAATTKKARILVADSICKCESNRCRSSCQKSQILNPKEWSCTRVQDGGAPEIILTDYCAG